MNINWMSIDFVNDHLYELISIIDGEVELIFLNRDGAFPNISMTSDSYRKSYLQILFIKPHVIDLTTIINGKAIATESLNISCYHITHVLNTLELLIQKLLDERVKLSVKYASDMTRYYNEFRMSSFLLFLSTTTNTHKSLSLTSLLHLRDLVLNDRIQLDSIPIKYRVNISHMVRSKSRFPTTVMRNLQHQCDMCYHYPCSHKSIRIITYPNDISHIMF